MEVFAEASWFSTATKLYSGSQKLRSTCSGMVKSKDSSPVDEEKIKMDDAVNTSFALEGIALFVVLWEAQPCFWNQNDIVVS